MPIASKSGTRRASRRESRRAWRSCDREQSRSGPWPVRRPDPLAELLRCLRRLVRFHEQNAGWLVPEPAPPPPPPLSPEWEAALAKTYGPKQTRA
jgi:hypothetical protein